MVGEERMKEQNNEWYQHEGLDRTHMLLAMLQEALGYVDEDSNEETTHPSIWNSKCEALLSEATTALADLYQAIGEFEVSEESD